MIKPGILGKREPKWWVDRWSLLPCFRGCCQPFFMLFKRYQVRCDFLEDRGDRNKDVCYSLQFRVCSLGALTIIFKYQDGIRFLCWNFQGEPTGDIVQ